MKVSDYLTRKLVAEEFEVTERTIDIWRKDRGLPFFKVGGSIRFDKSKVEEWIKDQNK